MNINRVGPLAILAVVACGDAADDGRLDAAEPFGAQEPTALTAEAAATETVTVGDPSEVYVRKVELAGSGCRPWSGFVQKSENQHYIQLSDFRFLFDFTRHSESFDCKASIDLHVPPGRTVVVSHWKLAGTARVDRFAFVDFSAGLGWQGTDVTPPVTARMRGGYEDVFAQTGTVGPRPCDGENRHLELDLRAEMTRAADASAGHTSLQSLNLVLRLDDAACPVR